MSTVESVCATFATCTRTLCSADEEPTISSNIEARSRSSRSAIVSLRIRSSMRFRSGRAHDALPPLIERAAEVRERRAIGVQALAFASQYGDELRREVENLPEFHFALAQSRRQLLLFCDVDSRSDEPLPLPVCRRDADATNVTNRSIGPNNPLGEVEAVMVREHLLNFVRNELPILGVHERHVLRYARSLTSRIEAVDREQFG